MNELVSQAQRWETIRKLTPDYILPISKQDVIGLFPNFTIHATNVGLDYAIWKYMFERSPIFAKIFWHIGVLSSNCFAVAEKQ
jgi:hypothetical protein